MEGHGNEINSATVRQRDYHGGTGFEPKKLIVRF
jgi:hypothetical protein